MMKSADQLFSDAFGRHRAGQVAEARALYLESLKLRPDDPVALHYLGVAAYQMGDLAVAETAIRQALAVDDTNAEAHNNLGNVLQKLERMDEAVSAHQRAATIAPAFFGAWYNLGNALESMDRLEEAGTAFRAVLALKPDHSRACNNLALVLERMGRRGESKEAFRQASALDPAYAEPLLSLGRLLIEDQEWPEAAAIYRLLTRLRPGDAGTHATLAEVLLLMEQRQDAVVAYQRAIELESGAGSAFHVTFGGALAQMGRFEEAAIAYQRAINIEPNPEFYIQLGMAEEKLGRRDDAIRAYSQAAALNPQSALANSLLGSALFNSMRMNEAIVAFQQAALQPDVSPDVHRLRALARAELGYIDEAASGLRQALAASSDIPGGRDLLDCLANGRYIPTTGLQGEHAPERQVYMAAAVHMKRNRNRPLRILEIGSYMGASMLTWAAAVTQLTEGTAIITCVDPWDGAALEQYSAVMSGYLKTGAAYRVFMNNVKKVGHRVEVRHRIGKSDEVLPTLREKFDIIYIDGCHLYDCTVYDIAACDKLLDDDGYVCGDDLELQMPQIDIAHARANLETDYIVDPRTGIAFHPGVTLGVGEFFGDVSVYRGFWIMQRSGERYKKVSLAGSLGCLPRHWPVEYHERIRDNIAADGVLSGMV